MGFWGSNIIGIYGQIILYLQIVVAIFLVAHILHRKQDPQACLGWLLAVALFPLVALVFYVGVGINPFHRLTQKKLQSRGIARPKSERLPAELFFENRKLAEFHGFTNFLKSANWISSQTHLSVNTNVEVDLLINSDAVYPELYRHISAASNFILVQFYQIEADEVGFQFLDHLAMKAKEGLKVHVLFDALGSFSLKESMIEKYRQQGIEFQRFLEIHPLKRRFQVNWRNHRKLVVLDGKVAFVGGFNIGKTYLQGSDKIKVKWVDIILRMKGVPVDDLTRLFLEDWHFTTGKILSLNPQDGGSISPSTSSHQNLVAIVPSGPTDNAAVFHSTLLHVLYEVNERLWIMTPYFVPDKSLLHALRLAVARGVQVNLVIPRNSNHPLTDLCVSSYFEELHAFGINVFRYPFGVCHGKVFLADQDLMMIGSSNMDYRSFFLNFETDIFIRDRTLATRVERFFLEIMSHSKGLTYEDIARVSMARHIVRRMMRLIAPLM